MDIHLPTLTLQPDWTAESQLVKCQEELDEIKEAVAAHDDVNAIREAFDMIQTGHTFLQIMDESYDGHLNVAKFLAEHEAKLKRKGYME